MKKAKIAVLGGCRGKEILQYCIKSERAELVAVCDNNPVVYADLEKFFSTQEKKPIITDSFDELLKIELDGIILANFANEHAPFAIRCLDAGINVMSEVLPAQTLKEAAELVDAVERSGKLYCFSENYCYLDAPREMRRLYKSGALGNLEYAEGEYFHNCEPIWHNLTYGNPEHWRNIKHAFYYCTHSLGPIIHSTGLRPISVTGFEPPYNDKCRRQGILGAPFAMEIVTLENGALVRSCHGQTSKNSVWFSMTCSKGKIEGAREAAVNAKDSPHGKVYASINPEETVFCDDVDGYVPKTQFGETESYGHALADRLIVENFISALLNEPCDIVDIYEAMDMFLPGIFAYKSVLAGGIPQAVPNFRDKAERDKWRSDISTTDRRVAKDQWIPSYSKGNPVIEQSVYDNIYNKWLNEQNKEDK